ERSPHIGAKAELEWRGKLRPARKSETGRHHSGEAKGNVAEVNPLSDDAAITAELALPEVVADQRDLRSTRHSCCARECAANRRRDTQHVEERSEERRVGKEGSARWGADRYEINGQEK